MVLFTISMKAACLDTHHISPSRNKIPYRFSWHNCESASSLHIWKNCPPHHVCRMVRCVYQQKGESCVQKGETDLIPSFRREFLLCLLLCHKLCENISRTIGTAPILFSRCTFCVCMVHHHIIRSFLPGFTCYPRHGGNMSKRLLSLFSFGPPRRKQRHYHPEQHMHKIYLHTMCKR